MNIQYNTQFTPTINAVKSGLQFNVSYTMYGGKPTVVCSSSAYAPLPKADKVFADDGIIRTLQARGSMDKEIDGVECHLLYCKAGNTVVSADLPAYIQVWTVEADGSCVYGNDKRGIFLAKASASAVFRAGNLFRASSWLINAGAPLPDGALCYTVPQFPDLEYPIPKKFYSGKAELKLPNGASVKVADKYSSLIDLT